jgi:hypothetical protein
MSPLPVGDQAIPKVTAKSTPEWLVTEGTQMTPSQPTLAQIAMTPKQVGAVVNFSRLLAKQTNAERLCGVRSCARWAARSTWRC